MQLTVACWQVSSSIEFPKRLAASCAEQGLRLAFWRACLASGALAPALKVSALLDVACGTGVLSAVAADLVKPDGSVVGLDLNAGMLDVAMRKALHIDWREAPVEAMPLRMPPSTRRSASLA